MKICVFVIFIVLQAITCEKAVSKLRKKLIVPKMNSECKKIKCASVEEPLCVKMKRLDLGLSMHIMAANKCELDYLKCHDDVEAKVVPMKYCGHNVAQGVREKKNKMGKHIRVKRRAVARVKVARNATSAPDPTKPEQATTMKHGFKGDDRNKLTNKAKLIRKKLARMQRNNFISNVISKTSVLNDINRLKKKRGADQHGRQNMKLGADQHGRQNMKLGADQHGRQNMKLGADQHGRQNMKLGADQHGRQNMKLGADQHGRQNYGSILSSETDSDIQNERLKFKDVWGNIPSKTKLNNEEIQGEHPPLSYRLDDFDMFSGETTNISMETLDSADMKEFDKLCPTVCPSRDVMVCGRCLHGIYKTFLSVCHMKMFLCNHKDEELELISRYPCVLSAPYLSDEGMKPKGVIRETANDDKVLRFLMCNQFPNGKSSCAASGLKDSYQGYREGERYFYFPGGDNDTLHLVDAQEPVDFKHIEELTSNPATNGYWLFTRKNPTSAQIIMFGDETSVAQSNFNFETITVFLAHGWKGNGMSRMNPLLTEAFLEDGDVNVIVLDWSSLAKQSYKTAKEGIAAVGRGLGQFINWLVGLGASYQKMHLVGFCLGGHLVGNAGKETGGRVKRITGLDPAGPLYLHGDNDRLVDTDAEYVEVIHTSTRWGESLGSGYREPCGDGDFYPNGGFEMPGCDNEPCSHSRSYEYMAISVTINHLLANACKNLEEANKKINLCLRVFKYSEYPMGNSDLNKSLGTQKIIFRVDTTAQWPYRRIVYPY